MTVAAATRRAQMYEYEGLRRKVYGDGLTFVPVCETCGRFVKADDAVTVNGFGDLVQQPNATCSRCGRVAMIFEGWVHTAPYSPPNGGSHNLEVG